MMFTVFHSVVALLLASICVSGLSTAPRPLKRIAHPSTLAIDILPRQPNVHDRRSFPSDPSILRHSDSFRLIVSAFGETYNIHLRPNDHLVHPAARVHYYSTTSSGETILTHSEPLMRESVQAYLGEVVPAHLSETKLRHEAAHVVPDSRESLGWARIMVYSQGDLKAGKSPVFEGAFTVNGVTHHITSAENYMRNKHYLDPHISISSDDPDSGLVIWRDSDAYDPQEEAEVRVKHGFPPVGSPSSQPATCAHDSMNYNVDPAENPALRMPSPSRSWFNGFGYSTDYPVSPNDTFYKRSDVAGNGLNTNFVNNIGQTAGCPASQKVVYMGVAADCSYTQRYGNQTNARQQILTDWNSASSVYKSTFNISLGILELQVFNGTCPTTADPATPWNVGCGSVTLNDRLSLFSQWRGAKGNDGTGLWHLLSQCTTGSEVGIAWLATLCQTSSSGSSPNVVSGTAVSTAGRTEWQVIAHEIGHNFGAIHDCTAGCSLSGTCCPLTSSTCDANSVYIMSPTASDSENKFSQCSLGNICSLMQGVSGSQTNTSCILDPDPTRHLISLQMCGNGIVEAGEDCDPGPGINSTCCDSTTCKFKPGAVCDPTSTPCCTSTCSLAPSSQLCRAAKNAICDTPEYCTGNSSTCPADVTAPNGKSCGPNGLACASGSCTSLTQQCINNGASLNLTQACNTKNDKSCLVTCQDPTSSNQCVVLQTSLVDGSPCGYGGTCINGSCRAGSWWTTFTNWYRQNLQIAIPVTVIVGLLALAFLWFLIVSILRCCARSRRKHKSLEPALVNVPATRIGSWPATEAVSTRNRVPPPVYSTRPARYSQHRSAEGSVQHSRQHRSNSNSNHWVDDTTYNGYRR